MSSSRSGSDDHRAGQHVLDRCSPCGSGRSGCRAVAGVLHLDLGEVLGRGAVEVHPAAGEQREVHRVGRAEQVEPQPVGIVAAFAADRGEEALRRGVGADDQRDVAEAGEDLGPGRLRGPGPPTRRRRSLRDRDAVPAQLLGERGAGDEAGVAVADGVGAGDELRCRSSPRRRRPARRGPRPCRTR